MTVVTALNLSDGTVVWSRKTTSSAYASSVSPIAVLNSTQLVVGLNHFAMDYKDSEDGFVAIINKSDGSMVRYTAPGSPIQTITVDQSQNVWFLTAAGQSWKVSSTLAKIQVYNRDHATIKFDTSGNIYVLSGNVVGKYNSSLTRIWQKTITIPSQANNFYVTLNNNFMDIDSFGNVYYFNSYENTGNRNGPIIKLNSADGSLAWARRFEYPFVNGYSTSNRRIRLGSDTDVMINDGTKSSFAKLNSDGSLLTAPGGSYSLVNYTSATIANNTAVAFFALTTSGNGNFQYTGSLYGWSTNTFTQTSTATSIGSITVYS
jgi:hypothetical protein